MSNGIDGESTAAIVAAALEVMIRQGAPRRTVCSTAAAIARARMWPSREEDRPVRATETERKKRNEAAEQED